MIAKKDPYIKSAYDQLQRISQDEQKRLEYEARRKLSLITIKACLKQNSAASETLLATFSHWALIFMSLQKQPIYP